MQVIVTAIRSATVPLRLRSFAASAALVVIACAAYRYAPFEFHRRQFGILYGIGPVRFTGGEFMFWAALSYIAALAVFHCVEPEGRASKALRALRVIAAILRSPVTVWRSGLSADDRLALLVSLLKAFFAPMMVMALMTFCNGVIVNGAALLAGEGEPGNGLLRGASYWFLLQFILFFDVLVFTVGYLVELPSLRNQIRSVDPSPYGWAAALACYPPINAITSSMLGSTISDFPQFDDATAHAVLNALLLLFLAIYSSASIALGWKGSNLTHRGIVSRGPYAYVRHPAYAAKNAAWWIGSLPFFAKAFEDSVAGGVVAILSMASWSALYVLRALTEEDHLRKVDGEYDAYAARVRYRFIPGVA